MKAKVETLFKNIKSFFKKTSLAEKVLTEYRRNLALLPAFDKLSLYVESCTNEFHLECAIKLVSLFRNKYGASNYYTKLCMKLQLQRIEIMHLNAVNELILNH